MKKDLSRLDKYRQKDDEKRIYGMEGDQHNGIYKVFVNGRSFYCIVSNGGGWDHISVGGKNKRIPTWDEMCAIKDMFFDKDEVCVQYHPAEENYINLAENVLHIWKPQNIEMPTPPLIMV